jgi:hypothetical protein
MEEGIPGLHDMDVGRQSFRFRPAFAQVKSIKQKSLCVLGTFIKNL